MTQHLSPTEAVRLLRESPAHATLVRDTYLDADVETAATRFSQSGEWAAVRELLRSRIQQSVVVDLGAGNGMTSRAFVAAGAAKVWAIEPDPSDEVGRGAIARCCRGIRVQSVEGFGEAIPLETEIADIVFARQVLHHTRDLGQTLRECARVLRSGGVFLACREHVAENPQELEAFLAAHPVHQLTGGEHAYRLAEYRQAITDAGLRIDRELGPWDSVINLFPAVNSDVEIQALPGQMLRERYGTLGAIASRIPFVVAIAAKRLRRPRPGRFYSFLATKP